MRRESHVRFGGRAGETHRSKDGRALRSDPYTSTASVAEEHDNEHVEHVEDGGVSMVTFFHDYISGPIVRLRCINCHVDGGLSGHTRVVFVRASDEADHESHNLRTFFYSLASGRKATAMRTDLNTVLNVF